MMLDLPMIPYALMVDFGVIYALLHHQKKPYRNRKTDFSLDQVMQIRRGVPVYLRPPPSLWLHAFGMHPPLLTGTSVSGNSIYRGDLMHAVCSICTGKINMGFVVDDEEIKLHVENDYIRFRGKSLLSFEHKFTLNKESKEIWKEMVHWLSAEILPSILHRLLAMTKGTDIEVRLPKRVRSFELKLPWIECAGRGNFNAPPSAKVNLLDIVRPLLNRKPAEILENLEMDVDMESGNIIRKHLNDDSRPIIEHKVKGLRINGKTLHADWCQRSMCDCDGNIEVGEGSEDGEIPEILKRKSIWDEPAEEKEKESEDNENIEVDDGESSE